MSKYFDFAFVTGCFAVAVALLEPHDNMDGLLLLAAALQFFMWAKEHDIA
jgi:hypothetical protein